MGNNKKISSSTRNAISVCHLKAFINVRCNSLPNLKIKCGRIKNFIVKSYMAVFLSNAAISFQTLKFLYA